MNALFTVVLLLLNGASAAHLRTHAKAATGAKATTVDGVEFTSIFDHPETASFFVNKKPEEVGHMITSAIYAHVKNHQNLATKKNIRDPDSLKQEAFVQLAAKHGVDFSTLKKLHARRVDPKKKDMEVWFHELAMHKETHVTHEEYALLEEQDKQAKETLALATEKNGIRATAKTAKKKTPFAKRYVIAPNDRYFAPDYDKHAHLAPLNERRQKRHLFSSPQKTTLGPSFLEAMKATRAASLIAVEQRRTEYILKLAGRVDVAKTENKNMKMKKMKQRGLQKNGLDNVLLKKPTATTFLQARVSRWENCCGGSCPYYVPDAGCDAAELVMESDIAQAALAAACPRNHAYNTDCNTDCQCASEHCDNTVGVGTWKCVHAYHSSTGGDYCTNDDGKKDLFVFFFCFLLKDRPTGCY